MKYTVKEKLEIAESIVTIIMFFMAVWGTVISFEEGFWHKLNNIVNHYHQEINKSTASIVEKKISEISHFIKKELP